MRRQDVEDMIGIGDKPNIEEAWYYGGYSAYEAEYDSFTIKYSPDQKVENVLIVGSVKWKEK